MDRRPIGVFDSGLGGLTVLRQIRELIPGEDIVYFGDIARVPYGSKSNIEILKYTHQAMNFFKDKNVKAVIIACNTATAAALNEIQEMYDIPVIGVIDGGVKSAIESTKNKRVMVIGTESTIKSEKYVEKIKAVDNSIEVYQKACPLFVYLVENGQIDTVKSFEITKYYLDAYKSKDIDTIVLGCTHYLHLKNDIAKVVGDKMNIVDPSKKAVEDLGNLLESKGISNTQERGKYKYYISGGSSSFKDVASKFMKEEIEDIEVIDIDNY